MLLNILSDKIKIILNCLCFFNSKYFSNLKIKDEKESYCLKFISIGLIIFTLSTLLHCTVVSLVLQSCLPMKMIK